VVRQIVLDAEAGQVPVELTRLGVELMWRTAPLRMPLDPADELRRLGMV
jgi:hypothetical protein